MGDILVSVIIPVYNIEPHLNQCLRSVVGQSLSEIEIICVDDGSTDRSPDILEEYAARDSRFHSIRQENAGPGAARNRGMELATGRYLIFLDSDDWFEPDFLAHMVERAEQTSADITICSSVEFDTKTGQALPSQWMLKTQYLPGQAFCPAECADYLFQFTYGWPWDKLYRREFIVQNDLHYPPLPNSEDLVFVFQSLALAEKISILDEPLVHHRVHRRESVSNSRHLALDVPAKALFLLEDSLKQHGLFSLYERSFLNWAMEFLVWNAANIDSDAAQREYFQKLRQEWFPALPFQAHPASYYFNRFAYAKYLLAKYAPYSVFAGIVSGYKALKRVIVRRRQ